MMDNEELRDNIDSGTRSIALDQGFYFQPKGIASFLFLHDNI